MHTRRFGTLRFKGMHRISNHILKYKMPGPYGYQKLVKVEIPLKRNMNLY